MAWEPAAKTFVGFKHESLNKDKITPGKFIWSFCHAANPNNTFAAEFAFLVEKRATTARFGGVHKFSDDLTGKVKAN